MIDLKSKNIMRAGDVVLEFPGVDEPELDESIQASIQRYIGMGFTPFGFSRLPGRIQYLLIPTYTLPLREVKHSTLSVPAVVESLELPITKVS